MNEKKLRKKLSEFYKKNLSKLLRKEAANYKTKLLNGKTIRYINLDNAATTSPFAAVEKTVQNFMVSYGSVHRGAGEKALLSTQKYESTREIILNHFGADLEKDLIVFSSNTTSAINQASYLFSQLPGKVLVSDIEHSANFLSWKNFNEVILFKTNADTTFNFNKIENALKSNLGEIKVLAVVGASNVNGHIPNIYLLAELAHKYGAKIFVDASQLAPHRKIDLLSHEDSRHVDFIAFSAHKMYAPYGLGVLIGPKSFFESLNPFMDGGGTVKYISTQGEILRQSFAEKHEPGTPNAVGAIALAESINILNKIGMNKVIEYERNLTEYALKKISKIKGIELYLDVKNNQIDRGGVIPFNVHGMHHALTAAILGREFGVGVRNGSFCTYEIVRKMIGLSYSQEKKAFHEIEKGNMLFLPGLVRASIGVYNSVEDIDKLVEALKKISIKGSEFNYLANKEKGEFIPKQNN